MSSQYFTHCDSLGCDRAQLVEAAEVLAGYGHSVAEERASSQGSLFGGDQVEAQRPRLPRIEIWSPSRRLDEELAAVGFYLSGHPLDDLMPALRRRRTDLLTAVIPKAEAGAEAFRMAGVVRRCIFSYDDSVPDPPTLILKAETLSFLHVLLVWGVELSSYLTKYDPFLS